MTDTLWYGYLVRCRDGSLDVGVTTDLERRMAEHTAGRGAKYTRSRRPLTLVWWECCATRSTAVVRKNSILAIVAPSGPKLALEPQPYTLRPVSLSSSTWNSPYRKC
jgi:putative endonuclease